MFVRSAVIKNLLAYGSTSKTTLCRNCSSSDGVARTSNGSAANDKLSRLMKQYEDFVGLTEVKIAQQLVLKAEANFIQTQTVRRERQLQIQEIQLKLNDIRSELDQTTRGEDRFLKLLTQEHALIKEEKKLVDEFKHYEREEREDFSTLSVALRKSHEQERSQAERTKYWSIIGSVCGAVIGIIGTTINNRIRMKELRALVVTNKPPDPSKTNEIHEKFLSQVSFQTNEIHELISEVKNIQEKIESAVNVMNSKINYTPQKSQVEDSTSQDNSIATEEWRTKISSLARVPMAYGALTVALPLLYFLLFKG